MNDSSPAPITVADNYIFACRILLGIKTLREHLGCPLQDAFIAFTERYEVLRRESPDRSSLTPEECWEGFHS
ncbi:hypothetical protein [Streptomyces sp. NBC_01408]|uniref:hypothetical protein n=1 Tax=Streptomyces sp. NBC_01408 TaxID=2903855 RepID=UPI002259000D|nr:hypothetical protein [Streptomyces sp. NBC_01408]MCX4692485.1 hypothetical protein [Streptomyces sp. NBC_01408]